MVGDDFITSYDGHITLSLCDTSKPASVNNITGTMECGDITAKISSFKERKDEEAGSVEKNIWDVELSFKSEENSDKASDDGSSGCGSDYDDDDGPFPREGHAFFITKHLDDNRQSFVAFSFEAGGRCDYFDLLAKKSTVKGVKKPFGLTGGESRRLSKLVPCGSDEEEEGSNDEGEDEDEDEDEESSDSEDGSDSDCAGKATPAKKRKAESEAGNVTGAAKKVKAK